MVGLVVMALVFVVLRLLTFLSTVDVVSLFFILMLFVRGSCCCADIVVICFVFGVGVVVDADIGICIFMVGVGVGFDVVDVADGAFVVGVSCSGVCCVDTCATGCAFYAVVAVNDTGVCLCNVAGIGCCEGVCDRCVVRVCCGVYTAVTTPTRHTSPTQQPHPMTTSYQQSATPIPPL